MKIFTNFSEAWIQRIAPERFNDEALFRIVTFFVFHTPCLHLSSMGKSLAEYNWSSPWKKPFYLNKQLMAASSNPLLLFSAATYDDMSIVLEKADLLEGFPQKLNIERICIYDSMKNQFLSVFFHLRNSFAHGRLNMFDVNGECYFVFEDIVKSRDDVTCKVSARMIIQKSTLLKWIDIIEGGEKEFKKEED